MDEVLTKGSIVKLDDGNDYMIIGQFAQNELEKDKIYDYIGCKYPKGLLEGIKLFDFNNIKKVLFRGYTNPTIIKILESARKEVKNG